LSMNPAIRQAILGVSGIVILSKLIGFLREVVIAERFGTSQEYDIFLLAISIPVFFQLVAMRATNFLIVPILSKMKKESTGDTEKRDIWGMFNSLFMLILLLLAAIIILAPYLVRMMAPDLDEENLRRGIFYCRVISLTVLLGFLESFLRSALNVKKHFVYPAVGTIILNVVIIFSIYLFSEKLSVAAIIIGTIFGLGLQVIFLLLKLWDVSVLEYFNFKILGGQVKNTLAIGGLIVLVELLMTTFFLIDRYFASDLVEGVVSSLKYAGVLVMLPVSIVGFTIAAVTFPYLSEKAGHDKMAEFSSLVQSSLSLALVIALPIGIFFLVFPKELIGAIFFRGAFDTNSMMMTSQILRAYAPYLVCLFLYAILIQVCYSSGRQKMVFWISLLAVGVKLILTWLFKTIFDYPGIALSTSVVHIMIFGIMSVILVKRGVLVEVKELIVTVIRILVAASPIFILGYLGGMLPDLSSETTFLPKMRVVPIAVLSMVLFIGIGYIINIGEIRSFLKGLKKRFG
jgi:putative peptidoglycan lipid II flippase